MSSTILDSTYKWSYMLFLLLTYFIFHKSCHKWQDLFFNGCSHVLAIVNKMQRECNPQNQCSQFSWLEISSLTILGFEWMDMLLCLGLTPSYNWIGKSKSAKAINDTNRVSGQIMIHNDYSSMFHLKHAHHSSNFILASPLLASQSTQVHSLCI